MSQVYTTELNGRTIKIEGPDDATDDELRAIADEEVARQFPDKTYGPAKILHTEPKPSVDAGAAGFLGFGDGATLGLLDEGGAVVDSLGLTGGRKNIWNGSSFGDAYKDNLGKNRAILHAAQEEHPVANFIGQGASLALPLGPIGFAKKAQEAGKVARVATEAGQGALYGFNSGEGGLTDRLQSAGDGAIIAGGLGIGGRTLGRAISPVVSPAVARLKAAGIPLTIGQIRGGVLKDVEDKLMSVPALGDLIKANRREGVDAFQRASINEALTPIKAKLPQDIPAGRDAINWAQNKASEAYDDALGTLHLKPDAEFATGMSDVRAGVGNLAEDQLADFERIVGRHVAPFVDTPIDGRQLQKIKIGLNDSISRYRKGSPRDQDVADALEGVRDEFMGMAHRQAPAEAKGFRDADTAYANMVPVNKASSKSLRGDGIPSPLQFSQAVRESDRSVNKRAFARGDARMQSLADAGSDVLPATVPDSGSPGRLFLNGALATAATGGSAVAAGPGTLALTAGALLPYAPGGRQLGSWLLTGRQGPVPKKIGKFLVNNAPFASVLGPRVFLPEPPQ